MSVQGASPQTFNLGNDNSGRPVFLRRVDKERWSLLRIGIGRAEIELTTEQVALIAQVASA